MTLHRDAACLGKTYGRNMHSARQANTQFVTHVSYLCSLAPRPRCESRTCAVVTPDSGITAWARQCCTLSQASLDSDHTGTKTRKNSQDKACAFNAFLATSPKVGPVDHDAQADVLRSNIREARKDNFSDLKVLALSSTPKGLHSSAATSS